MSTLAMRRAGLAGAVLLLLSVLLLASAGHADAATLYACKSKKKGAVRLVGAKTKCKKSESKLTWTSGGAKGDQGATGATGAKGDTGAAGAKGDKGDKGDPGQPQKVIKFSASQASTGASNLVPLFAADGVQYSFNCGFAFVLNVARIMADGPSGTSYASGTLARPSGVSRQAADPWSANVFATLGSGAQSIAENSTLSNVGGSIEQLGVWTATVEGPNATTWIHAKIDANSTCSVQGTAISIPNS